MAIAKQLAKLGNNLPYNTVNALSRLKQRFSTLHFDKSKFVCDIKEKQSKAKSDQKIIISSSYRQIVFPVAVTVIPIRFNS